MATEFNPGGVKAVHHSATAAADSWTQISGPVAAAENLEEALIEQITTNSAYQSGGSINPTITFVDHDDKATIRGFAVGNSRAAKYFAIEFFNGKIYRTSQAVFPMVQEAPKGARSEGDSGWKLSLKLDDDAPYTAVSSLTS